MVSLRDALIEFNPWWKGEFLVNYKDRDIYSEISKVMDLDQIIALTGIRRVGKTTLLYKLIKDKIASGFDPKDIIYFSFDEWREVEIREILKEYESIFNTSLNAKKTLLVLDEIQKNSNWESQLKVIYDLYKGKIKIIISGSESLFIKKKSKETLAGRLFEFRVTPLTFKEYLGFRNIKYEPISLYENELKRVFDEFSYSCGFPELIEVRDKEIIRKYVMEGIVEKIVYKDIPLLVGVRDPSILYSILNHIMENPGELIDISKLADDFKITRLTASAYLRYLEDSYLIRKVYNFSTNRRKTERKLKKYYPTVISPSLLFKEDELSRSKAFECLLINELDASFFWRDPYKNEVDIVTAGERPIPIEIKYGKIDFAGIVRFMRRFGVNEGYVISKEGESTKEIDGMKIHVIPAYKFLLTSKMQARGSGTQVNA